MKDFSCKTRIISGPGGVAALKELCSKRLLVVTDPFFEKNGTAKRLAELSGAPETKIYSGVEPDPSAALVAQGTAVVQNFKPDTVVALGGGSAMDCAKAMVYFSGLSLCFAAIPTTSGSGSEVTDFAVLTHDGVKHPLIDPTLQPDVAILDSELLKELPSGLIADTGFDVLSHALEAMVAVNADSITDALAQSAFSKVFSLLPQSFRGNLSVRQEIHEASTMAGMAFNRAGLGLCHAMAHAMGGIFHLPHGRLNAILLPAVVGVNAHNSSRKYAQIAQSAGLGSSGDAVAVRNLKNGLCRLRKELNLPATLVQAGLAPYKVWRCADRIVETALADPCCNTNPVQVEDFMIRRVLEEVTGRA